jgi:hypothetical protein
VFSGVFVTAEVGVGDKGLGDARMVVVHKLLDASLNMSL